MHKGIYFPGLNGLRAIAAFAVVLSHTTQSLGEFGLDPNILGKTFEGTPLGLELAGFGVSIFFTLSGFLITYLLLLEKEKGSINIRDFYMRRILRIWPLYYLYLSLVLVTIYFWQLPLENNSLLFYVFLMANIPAILGIPLPLLLHYWSLGVEEQFYAFWPWLMRMKNDKLIRISIVLIIVLMTLKIIFRIIAILYDFDIPYLSIHITRFHCMLLGCIGAMFLYRKNRTFIRITTHYATQIICWILLLIAAINQFHFFSVIDNELISVIALCLILSQVQAGKKIINLENDVMDFLGKISYGIYVFHPLIIFYLSKAIGTGVIAGPVKLILVYLAVSAATILIAWLSYRYFEKPFLRLKLRYSVVPSTAARHS